MINVSVLWFEDVGVATHCDRGCGKRPCIVSVLWFENVGVATDGYSEADAIDASFSPLVRGCRGRDFMSWFKGNTENEVSVLWFEDVGVATLKCPCHLDVRFPFQSSGSRMSGSRRVTELKARLIFEEFQSSGSRMSGSRPFKRKIERGRYLFQSSGSRMSGSRQGTPGEPSSGEVSVLWFEDVGVATPFPHQGI